MAAEAAFNLKDEGAEPVLALSGDWTVDTIAPIEPAMRDVGARLRGRTKLNLDQLGRLDVAGAYLIDRTLRASGGDEKIELTAKHETAERLLASARAAVQKQAEPPEEMPPFIGFLDRVGRESANLWEETVSTLSFLGETLVLLARMLVNPRRIRWVSVVSVMEQAGLNALPIITLLSFFIGLVVAYLGASILADFGASVFTVDLVAFAVLREFAVVITAVLLAGRTNSAFTAEIGAMKMRQEIDAMRVMGIDPMEALVVPRVLAMLVMTPILTFAATMTGLFGGLLVCWATLGVSTTMFVSRIANDVPVANFWVGMCKSPVFALVLAVIACRQGLQVGGDVGSLGKRTTASVVQSIFMVILIDAVFALWFRGLDI